jgi:serine/threonine protein phosphatase PrpC
MQEALQNNFESGSTATVVLIADGQIISANVGDSKAFLCSEGYNLHHRNSYVSFFSFLDFRCTSLVEY